jgi:TorA maturation chaperone TorD
MNERLEQTEIVIANRSYLYQLQQGIFGSEPTVGLLTQVTSKHTQQAIELFYDPDTPEVKNFLTLLERTADALSKQVDILIDNLSSEYVRLFYGPDVLPAPPWESVYATGQQVLFQESTLNVRRAFVKWGYLPQGYPNEPDDHLAYELDFMYNLAKQTHERFIAGEYTKAKATLEDQQLFLQDHLLKWVGKFSERLQEFKEQNFYSQCAEFLVFFLKSDNDVLAELLQELE